jgi:circadian clock protein KaiB
MSFGKWADELPHGNNSNNGNHAFEADRAGDAGWQAAEVTPEDWRLRLYVSGESPKSLLAYANLKQLCETCLAGRYQIEIVDLLEHPILARDEEIVAVPMLVRLAPTPIRKIIGDLSDADAVLIGLQIRPKHL